MAAKVEVGHLWEPCKTAKPSISVGGYTFLFSDEDSYIQDDEILKIETSLFKVNVINFQCSVSDLNKFKILLNKYNLDRYKTYIVVTMKSKHYIFEKFDDATRFMNTIIHIISRQKNPKEK